MHPSQLQNTLSTIEALLLSGSEAVAPTNPGVSRDIELGVLLFGFASQLFHHSKPAIAAAMPKV